MIIMIFQDGSLGWMLNPPGSMLFILFLSLIVSIISVILTKLLVDTEELERKQKQIKAHQEEKKKIIEIANEDVDRYRKARKKWERKDIILKKSQQGMALQRLKPTLITFVPMIIIFAILRGLYGNDPVAATPMNPELYGALTFFVNLALADRGKWIGDSAWLNFTGWYFICSLGLNTLIQRILKLQTQASGGMEQMFGGQKSAAMEFPDI
ncbi:MAG: DUF106 domain-containing protein [Candidatus Lokiarchaeota archaeon]|nr:DUF106 domain-containing protein [Candidatus Lokiarchaeota archaeon]MBD3338162.1 DUF106 domain-containing protein [Candidatus Lokiarchaeota archaeon]